MRKIKNILIFVALIWAPGGISAQYFVDSLYGSDRNIGSSLLSPWRTLKRASQQHLKPGDQLLLRSADRWPETLRLSSQGNAQNPIVISTFAGSSPAQIETLEISRGAFVTISNLVIDPNQQPNDAVLIKHSKHLRLEQLELRNGIKDGIDIQDSEDIEIIDLYIHHFLAGSFKQQKDAHGIVASNTQRLSIISTEIHHTSGDSFQADPARVAHKMSNDIVIRDSHFWTSPLSKDFNSGWQATADLPENQRQYPGENAIDTKVVQNNWENAPRMRLNIDGLLAHGWKADGYISNKAVFNLKEKIDISLNNVTVYDCEIAFRLRGNRGNALVRIDNVQIDQCDTGIRAEDGLQGLKVTRSTFGNHLKQDLVVVGRDTRQSRAGWSFENNLFFNKIPQFLKGGNNRIRPPSP